MTILVTGATGRIGRHLVARLLADGHTVRVLTRRPESADLPDGVEVVAGDLTETRTLADAFAGVEAAHLITFGGDDGADLTNGDDIVALARRCGARQFSVLAGWAPTSVESALEATGSAWCRIEPVEVMYNTVDWAEEIREHDRVSTMAMYPSAIVHEADIADVAACALTQDGHAGARYRVTGPEALTPAQRVAVLADVVGRPLTHVRLTEEEERARLAAHGFGDEYVEFGMRLATDPPEAAGRVLDTVSRLTGRPGRTFAQWAREHASGW